MASLHVGGCERCAFCSKLSRAPLRSSSKLCFAAWRTSIPSIALGIFGIWFPPMGSGHAVFPANNELKVCGIRGWKPSTLLYAVQTSSRPAGRRHGVTGGSALRSPTAFRRQPPRGRLRWLLLQPLPSGHTHEPLSYIWCPWDPGGYTRSSPVYGWCPTFVQKSKIKSPSSF